MPLEFDGKPRNLLFEENHINIVSGRRYITTGQDVPGSVASKVLSLVVIRASFEVGFLDDSQTPQVTLEFSWEFPLDEGFNVDQSGGHILPLLSLPALSR